MKIKKIFFIIVLLILIINITFAQGADVKGSSDHPLISRYPGSTIIFYDSKEFEEYVLALGKFENNKLTKSQKLEGKVTQITYAAPQGRSILEIYKNYESALKKAGFETLFSGKDDELGGKAWIDAFVSSIHRVYDYLGAYLTGNYRYLAAKLTRPEGDIYVALCVSLGWFSYAIIQLDIVEVAPMEAGLIKVNAEALAKDITATGHASVYGIYFDTGKADLKPESEEALKEIAKLLTQNPKLKIYVVGHTDNIGDFNFNMELSKARAESVVKALVSIYGVDASRLIAYGVGPLCPVASNSTEEGKAKNRRVELVEQ